MRFHRSRGNGYRDIRFDALDDLKHFIWFGCNANKEHLWSILHYDNRSFDQLEQYVSKNPSDTRAKNALILWKQARQLCSKAEGLIKQAEENLKRF